MTELEDKCLYKASKLIEAGLSNLDLFQLTDLLLKLEEEKAEKSVLTDQNIDYNDEIVSIEDCGVKETLDISVSGDNLFYCNGVLTKNSFGLPATADFMVALISTEELEGLNQIMVKQLKNRYSDKSNYKRFVVGIDRAKMRLYDVEQSAQNEVLDTRAETSYNGDGNTKPSLKEKFGGFKFD